MSAQLVQPSKMLPDNLATVSGSCHTDSRSDLDFGRITWGAIFSIALSYSSLALKIMLTVKTATLYNGEGYLKKSVWFNFEAQS